MTKSPLFPLLKQELSEEQLLAYLPEQTPSYLKNLLEEAEYYLLCYPQGTGNAALEELLSQLANFFYAEESAEFD